MLRRLDVRMSAPLGFDNTYALGMRLFYFIEEMVDKGQLSWDFQNLEDSYARKHYDTKAGEHPFELPGLWFDAAELYSLLAAHRLGLPPAACLVIEDSPTGSAAGLAAVG